jgi:hypothetical protein
VRGAGPGLVAALALALPAVAQPPIAPLQASVVRATDYDAFWLWGGVAPQPALARARVLYLLRGQVSSAPGGSGPARLIAQGGSTPHLGTRADGAQVWIVYRAHTLDWPPDVYGHILDDIVRWRAAGNAVAGVQIDFDAHTRHLDRYAAFLKDLRARLPKDDRLSITGLLDWSSQGDPGALDTLGGMVDEVVLQTYQGRRTIPGYQAYLARLERLKVPFKIGLIEGGDWTAPPALAANPWFRGYVVFLKNP